MCAEAPIRCPVCSDPLVEPMENVQLSVTFNGVPSQIHGVSAYHCQNWHVFTLIFPLDHTKPLEGGDQPRGC